MSCKGIEVLKHLYGGKTVYPSFVKGAGKTVEDKIQGGQPAPFFSVEFKDTRLDILKSFIRRCAGTST